MFKTTGVRVSESSEPQGYGERRFLKGLRTTKLETQPKTLPLAPQQPPRRRMELEPEIHQKNLLAQKQGLQLRSVGSVRRTWEDAEPPEKQVLDERKAFRRQLGGQTTRRGHRSPGPRFPFGTQFLLLPRDMVRSTI